MPRYGAGGDPFHNANTATAAKTLIPTSGVILFASAGHPSTTITPSLKIVFEITATTTACYACVGVMRLASAIRAHEIVIASMSVSPEIAATPKSPDVPRCSRAPADASSTTA